MPDMGTARTRSVDSLQRLYTVVVSLAIAERLRQLLAPCVTQEPEYPDFDSCLMFFSLIVTVIPFYHGANRYLDATYVTGERHAKPGTLMLDFLALFAEAILLFVLAMFATSAVAFYIILVVLLVFDAGWVTSTYFTAMPPQSIPDYIYRWGAMNVIAAVLILTVVGLKDFAVWKINQIPTILLFVFTLLRSILDYYLVWHLYYPHAAEVADGNIPAPPPAPPPSIAPSAPEAAK